jgi:hypothetical protein
MPDINTPNYPVTESPRLSPNPKLTTSYEDGGRGTPTIVVTEAKEQPDTTGVSLPEYTGDYEITENGTLPTEGKVMTSDLSVNVTLPEYTGSYTVTSNGTLPTAGKAMTNDLVVNVQAEDNPIVKAWEVYKSQSLHATKWNSAFSCYDTDNAYQYVETLDFLDFSGSENITSMATIFRGCYGLKTLPLFDMSNVTNLRFAFNGCSNIETVPAYNVSNATDLYGVFNECAKLKTIHMFGMKVSFNLSSANNYFTREALLEVINNCADLTGQTAQTLKLGNYNLERLTNEDKAIATNKNWTLA